MTDKDIKWAPSCTVKDLDKTLDTTYGIAFKADLNKNCSEICNLVGAHQGAISYLPEGNFLMAIHVVVLSEKYEEYATYDVMPNGAGIWGCAVHLNRPMRLEDAALKSHKNWKNFSGLKDKRGLNHPPMRGWLAVPVKLQSGDLVGLLQLTDKFEGDFTQKDEEALLNYAADIGPMFESYYEKTHYLR